MPDPQTTTIDTLPLTGKAAAAPLSPMRPGMPALDTVHATKQFSPVAGQTYNIISTTETDSYEKSAPAKNVPKLLQSTPSPSAPAVAAAVKSKPPSGDNFGGTDRKAAKLSKGTGPTEQFADVKDLIASLAPESTMLKHTPKILTNANSGRVKEEQRNVKVSAFLYAASREADNDFHLIVGRDHTKTPEMYMTMELSGLPPKNAPVFADLNNARKAFKKFFGSNLPKTTYDFYDPPIPVEIEGSLFFDMTHAKGSRPGPPSLKSRMPVIWEVHPVTSIKLG